MDDDDSLFDEIAGHDEHDRPYDEHDNEPEHEDHRAELRGRRRSPRADDGESRFRSLLPALVVIVVILALGAGGYAGYSWMTGKFGSSTAEEKDYPGPGTGEATVVIKQGDGGGDIARTLKKSDVIKSEGPFINVFQHSSDAAGIDPGTYRLKKRMSAAGALDALLDPKSFAGKRVTIPEGHRNTVVFQRLSKATDIPVKDFEAAAKDYRALGVPENPAKSAEGYLWPGRYDIPDDATAKSILTMMVKRMNQELDRRKVPEDERYRILTLASIAEKEARQPEDYGKVVRTLENRLSGEGGAKGHPMRLQLDSTVAYVSGRDSISTTPAERKNPSPYNTYVHDGLPIGPISNPGGATIDAALNPPKGPWIYWVAVNTQTGETVFSTNLADHQKAVQQWRGWAKNKDKG